MQTAKLNNDQKILLLALLLSLLLIHVPVALLVMNGALGSISELKPVTKRPEPIFVNLQPQARPQRIVDIRKPKNQRVPQRASAQSLYNSSVKQETTARYNRQKGGQVASAGTQATQQQPQAQQKTTAKSQPAPRGDPLKPQTSFPSPTAKPDSGLSLKDQLKGLRTEAKVIEQEKHSKTFASAAPAAMPTFKSNVGGSGEDFLPEYKVGNRTFVNTLANPHVGYYVELRRRFRTAFNPVPVLRPIYQRIMSRSSVSVILGVSVDPSGRVSDMIMIRSSGIPQYDQEARRTISSSAPFTRPPAEYLDKDGRLNMAWTFTVYL